MRKVLNIAMVLFLLLFVCISAAIMEAEQQAWDAKTIRMGLGE